MCMDASQSIVWMGIERISQGTAIYCRDRDVSQIFSRKLAIELKVVAMPIRAL